MSQTTTPDRGEALRLEGIGLIHGRGGVAPDRQRAAALFRQAVDLNSATAAFNLAWCLEYGVGVAKDEREACALLELASERGCAQATYAMALHLLRGSDVVEKNEGRAVALLKTASDAGVDAATKTLADCYKKGRGVPINEMMAERIYASLRDKWRKEKK